MRLLILLLVFVSSAFAVDTTAFHLWIPGRAEKSVSNGYPAANVLRCTRFIAQLGITGTQIGWETPSGGGGGAHCGVGIYTEDGATLKTSSGAVDCSASGNKVATGLTPFTLNAGEAYQVCVCSDAGGGAYLAADTVGGILTAFQNILSVPLGTMATSTCTAGAPPNTTGPLSSSSAATAPIVLIGTDTP